MIQGLIRSKRRRRRGFTLVEIILVTVIILILVSIVGPRLAGRSKKAKISTAKIEMHGIKSALQNFEIHASRFPTQQEGLQALITKPAELDQSEWDGPYLDDRSVPKDPFNHPYKYVYPSEHGNDYDLLSSGPDGNFGSEDDILLFEAAEGENL
jgi:general secretion pathway protein G